MQTRLVMQTPKNQGLFGKGLKSLLSITSQNVELYSVNTKQSSIKCMYFGTDIHLQEV